MIYFIFKDNTTALMNTSLLTFMNEKLFFFKFSTPVGGFYFLQLQLYIAILRLPMLVVVFFLALHE
jgi:hypothetical protein